MFYALNPGISVFILHNIHYNSILFNLEAIIWIFGVELWIFGEHVCQACANRDFLP